MVVCPDCRMDEMRCTQIALLQLNQVQNKATLVAKECSKCSGCFEDSESFASLSQPEDSCTHRQKTVDMISGGSGGECLRIPLANCVCIDCPNTFRRHNLREQLIEATATCVVLNLL